MSPEQILGQRAVDGRSDQFALAATLYELLALEPAFAGDERESVFHAILSVDPTPPRELDPRVPRDLEVVVLHALEKEPRRRYASCAELADDLQRFLDYEPLRARPVRWPGRIARRARRNPVAAAAIAVAALAVVAAPFGAALHARERTRETAGAELAAARADRGRLSELRAALNRSQRELASREEHAEPGAPRAEREALRNARREVARLGREVETAFRESLGHASTALRIDPRCGAGREIAAAAFGELLDAERSRDRQRAADLRSLLLTYDDGELAPLLDARGSVSIATSNGSARAHLFRCVDQDELRVAVPAAARDGAIDREALASFDARGPWVWLRIDGVEPANFGLAAGDEITSVCGEPPVDGAAIAAHLSAPHAADPPSEHVIEFLRSGEPLSASFAPCTTLALSGERTSRPAFPLRCDAFNDLGETPIRELSLAMGSYLIVLGAGEREVRVPFEVRRSAETLAGEHVELSVDLARAALLGDEFVYVAGGRAALGGDQRALATLPLHDAEVEPFYVQRREVTFGEYFEFLHWLDRCDPRAAEERAPRQGAARTRQWMPLWKRADKSWPIEPALPPGVGLDWPLVCISFGDAEAYCQWRNEVGGRDDLEFALPTEGEWEKAARGVDSRTFAWGDGFDWTLARLGKTWHVSGLARGELFATDESIYGVRDMNGSVREWCAGPPPPAWRIVRGGGWNNRVEGDCHPANRAHDRPPDFVDTAIGFRLVARVRKAR
jgi:formylglycine-generating enzyme required for sulfatase activity